MDDPGRRQRVALQALRGSGPTDSLLCRPRRDEPFLPYPHDLMGVPSRSVGCCRRCRNRRSGPASSRTGGRAARGSADAGFAGTSRSPQPARARSGPFAVTCRTMFLPFRDRPHTWVKPRKSNVVPTVSGWRPSGRLSRKSTRRVLSGWSVSPYRPRRLPSTASTRLRGRDVLERHHRIVGVPDQGTALSGAAAPRSRTIRPARSAGRCSRAAARSRRLAGCPRSCDAGRPLPAPPPSAICRSSVGRRRP